MAAVPVWAVYTALAASTAATVYSQYQQSVAQKEQANYEAAMAERRAQAAKQQYEYNKYQLERRKRLTAGKQASLYAKAGVLMTGSPLEVLSDTAAQYDIDIATAKYNAQVGISNAKYAADYSRYSGKQAMKAGYVQMGGTLMSNVYKAGVLSNLPSNPTGIGGTKSGITHAGGFARLTQ